MGWKIPLFKMHCDQDDIQSVSSVLKRGMFWGLSSETVEWEKMLADKVGVDYCVVFNSGTSALHATMLAHGIKKGDQLLMPSFTFIATANAALFVNAVPKFAEIEDETFGLDPNYVQKSINSKTKAIVPVHYAGSSCQIHELREIASDSKILMIEDAAAALGAKSKGRMCGSFGDSSIISFAWNKVITSGEGGAVLTNSKRTYEKLILIRSHGRIDKETYFMSATSPEYVSLGFNWRVSAMTAALGISQLEKLDRMIEMRRKNSSYLSGKLSKIPSIEVPKSIRNNFHTYTMYTIRIRNGIKTRNKLHDFLTKKGIQTKVIYEPIHLTKFYREEFRYKKGFLKNTERIADEILSLPMYPHLKIDEMKYIIESIEEFSEHNSKIS